MLLWLVRGVGKGVGGAAAVLALGVVLGVVLSVGLTPPAWALTPSESTVTGPDVVVEQSDATRPYLDVHGDPPVVGNAPGDPISVWAPPPLAARRWAISAVGEYATGSAQLLRGDELVGLLDQVVAANLSAYYAPIARLGFAITVPVLPLVRSDPQADGTAETAVGIGDIRVAVPIGIVGSEEGTGFGLAVIPWVAVPTFTAPVLTSAYRPSSGALVTAGLRGGRASVTGAVGPALGPAGGIVGIPVRTRATASLGVGAGVRIVGAVWLGAEVRGRANLGRIDPALIPDDVAALPPPPVEGFLTLSVGGGAARAVAGAGSHLTESIGAAAFRAFAGVAASGAFDRRVSVDVDDELREFVFHVTDAVGPVSGAEIVSDGAVLAVSGADGDAKVQGDAAAIRWSRGVEVRDARHVTATVPEPARGATEVAVVLEWRPVPIGAEIHDVDGNTVPATLVARGADGTEWRGAPGQLELPPGVYTVEITPTDPALAAQERVVVVGATGAAPDPIDAIALQSQGDARIALRILDPEGNPVSGARVLIGGVPVGTTADGGILSLRGLPDGNQDVEIQHPAFTAEGRSLTLTADATEAAITLQRQPGSVRVRVRSAAGQPVTDATVRFVGPARLPAMALGPAGERTQVLSPGEWVVVVTSPTLGIQERDVIVPPDRYELITVDVVLNAVSNGAAELSLRVVAPNGVPIEGATVVLDGQPVGATSTGGTTRLVGLAPGPRAVAITGPDLVVAEPKLIPVRPGLQDLTLTASWKPGTVDVLVRGPDGPVRGAQVRFVGPTAQAPLTVGTSGRVRTQVSPGGWTVVVTSPSYGVQERDLVVDDSGNLAVVAFVLAPVEGGVANVTVHVEVDHEPIDQASVLIDGELVGATANGGSVRLTGLKTGPRRIEVRSERGHTDPFTQRLVEGDQDVTVKIVPTTGVRVRVHHGGVPVTDATVRVLGPTMNPAGPVDKDGEYFIPVKPAFWLVVVTSPSLGVAEQDVDLMRGIAHVEVELVPPVADRTDLMVTVVDPSGAGVEHAKVWVGDTLLDQTAQGGTVLVRGVKPGPATIRVEAPDFVSMAPLETVLDPGAVRYTFRLAWVTIPVEVRTETDDGTPIDALVQWTGPEDRPPVHSGDAGRVSTILRPGTWRVFARAGAGGELDAEARVRLDMGDEPPPVRLVLAHTGARVQGETVVIDEHVQFDFGRATLRPDSDALLDQVARAVAAQPTVVRIEVQGHTDNIGTVVANQALSTARAEAVVTALVARGVPAEILDARGYGPTRPIAPNDTEEGRADNRRVQFVVKERGAP